MAISFSETAAQVILNNLDTTLAGGTLVLKTSGDVEVATITLASDNIFSSISGNVGTFANTVADGNATGGSVSKFELYTSGSVLQLSGTVTGSGGGGDLIIENTTVTAGVSVNMNSDVPITLTLP